MDNNVLNFKISSALKDLIGKELITDQYVAIFELVKNSFDAHANEVVIIFENATETEKARIIIQDNGKGMSYKDLINKWLFVAYSAKKDGTEDEQYEQDNSDLVNDYRNKIKPKRVFAGAKGVGRFSCDRLGTKLCLITKKNELDSSVEELEVNWEYFENDSKEEFINVPVQHRTVTDINQDIKHGTILEISGLRDCWDRDTLLKLKRSLEKLINPNQENDSEKFSVKIVAVSEIEKDKSEKYERNKVNGYVKNTVFETLNLKTTQIISELSNDGRTITTTLKDRGTLIYSIKEKNSYNSISNIKIHLFILNRAAKFNFSKLMGVDSVNYGSVFVYKNGFRIYPYGEVGEDIFDIDKRKTQGHSRYFGTRELIGRIEINGNEDNLKETTSRDGGLIKNQSYYQLSEFFSDKALKRLEKYVFEVIKWGDSREDKETGEVSPALNPEDVKSEILDIIANLSRASNLISVDYDKNFLQIINEKQEKSATTILKNLTRSAQKINDPILQREVENTTKYFNDLLITSREITEEKEQNEIELRKVKSELEQTAKQNLFLKAITTTETKDVVALQHHIDRSTERINFNIDNLLFAINNNEPKEQLISYLKKISLENEKIQTVSRFVTRANFNMKAAQIEDDLVQFVNEYLQNVYAEYKHLKINRQLLNVVIQGQAEIIFNTRFRPLEIIIVLDNLLSNAYKAKAKNVYVHWKKVDNKTIQLSIIDDGVGISDDKLEKIFDFGYTTTDGSGIGLYHVKDIVENKIKGKLFVNNRLDTGVEFILEVKNEA